MIIVHSILNQYIKTNKSKCGFFARLLLYGNSLNTIYDAFGDNNNCGGTSSY